MPLESLLTLLAPYSDTLSNHPITSGILLLGALYGLFKLVATCLQFGIAWVVDGLAKLFGAVKRTTVLKPSSDYRPKVISMADKEAAGRHGERLCKQVLDDLRWRAKIAGFMSTENMFVNGEHFEIDYVVFVHGVGIVIIEVKHNGGETLCSNHRKWQQTKADGTVRHDMKNASGQVLRATEQLRQMFGQHLHGVSLIPVVVFTHPKGVIKIRQGRSQPATDIILLEMLENWLDDLPRDDALVFDRRFYNWAQQVLKSHEQAYEKPEHVQQTTG